MKNDRKTGKINGVQDETKKKREPLVWIELQLNLALTGFQEFSKIIIGVEYYYSTAVIEKKHRKKCIKC